MESTELHARAAGRSALVAVVVTAVAIGVVSLVASQGPDHRSPARLVTVTSVRHVSAGGGAAAAAAAGTTTTVAAHDMAAMGGHGHDAAGTASGHHHPDSPTTYAQLPAKTKAQVDIAKAVAAKYPTAADAMKDGWVKATRSLYGIGAHYLKGGAVGFATSADNRFDAAHPEILLFDGEGPDAKIAGVSYLVAGPTPEGFDGPFDIWHRHAAVCFQGGLVISETEAEGSPINLSDAQCKARGGLVFPIATLSMIHVWVGKGYMEADVPIFAHDHPKLYDGYRAGADV